MILAIAFLVLQSSFAIFIFFLIIAFATGGPFVPSSTKSAKHMIGMAQVKEGQRAVDLGSGDGRILFLAAAAGAKEAVGYEINPFLVAFTNIRAWFSPYRGKVRAVWRSLWKANLKDTDVVFVYLLPWEMDKLVRLLRTMRPTAKIVTNTFLFRTCKPIEQDYKNHVYVYRVQSLLSSSG